MTEIKKYVKERDEMLEKFSVKEFDKFIEVHKHYYIPEVLERFKEYTDEQKYLVLCNMIKNATSISKETKKKAKEWMEEFDKRHGE